MTGNGLLEQLLPKEYDTLSKAVHSSNPLFRMTDGVGNTNFANTDVAELGKWSTRERATSNINFSLLFAYFHKEFEGAKLKVIRTAGSICITAPLKQSLKDNFNINI